MAKFNPQKNFEQTKKAIGYVSRKQAKQSDYDRIGFMSGLEVHQQLKTDRKLFCKCPAGVFHKNEEFDAEIVRHMRPTLSEKGEYDGTALMEFKTRKEIIYRINNETACTYEVDDTPPFPIDRDALEKALKISLLSKLNIVGEVHITRKQYLDGSIPTGFQRTAILGVEGEIPLKNKKIRLIQLSIEEDSCREISDIGHTRVYKTDRLGMPLIETVTYPECMNPDEIKEACDYIRFLNRSTGLVRTGIGAGRQDVNVSCKGGTRIEIKGVSHTKWIPELTHVECYRQWALLAIRKQLLERVEDTDAWDISHQELDFYNYKFTNQTMVGAKNTKQKLIAVNLPNFHGVLSHFTQKNRAFADEYVNRLKVIAGLERPNMTHSEDFESVISDEDWKKIKANLGANEMDAQIVFWGPDEDIETALDVIQERSRMAFDGVPEETRKCFDDGTTIFERVLPGADRMYPDTDSAPIPLENEYIDSLSDDLPSEIIDRYNQFVEWGIPEDTYTYLLSKNYYPIIKKIIEELGVKSSFVGTLFGHKLKWVEGHYAKANDFNCEKIYDLLKYLLDNKIDLALAKYMLAVIYEHPKMGFDSVLSTIKFKKVDKKNIVEKVSFLKDKFNEIRISDLDKDQTDWIMGQLHKEAVGNMSLSELSKTITK